MNDILVAVTGEISGFLYTYILLALLVFCGIYFTIRTRGVQVRFVKDMFTQLTEKKHVQGEKAMSSFQALMVSTASRVGTGNIAGVATAIATGGPGAVFWMWLMAVFGASTAFIESTLAQVWKVRGDQGEFRGGPAYYMHQALGKRWVGVLFSILLILCFAFGFNGLQSFNATSALEYYFPNYQTNGAAVFSGLLLALMTAFCIFGGSKRISAMTSLIVPVMAIAYIIIAVWTVLTNIAWIPEVFSVIFASAFDFQSIFGGFAGSVVMLGIKRGLYSNEAGMGSAPNAAASASVSHPAKQGLVQALSVYIDTLLICTCSAMMVMVFYVQDPAAAAALNGMPLVQMAVSNSVGTAGIHFITFSVFLFAFSSLLGNYFYAESNFKFITESKLALLVFRLVCLVVIYTGAIMSFDLAWNLADIFMGFMALMNLIVILMLGKWAYAVLRDYEEQRKAGKDPVFLASSIEGLPATQCWHVPEGQLEEVGDSGVSEYVESMLEVTAGE